MFLSFNDKMILVVGQWISELTIKSLLGNKSIISQRTHKPIQILKLWSVHLLFDHC